MNTELKQKIESLLTRDNFVQWLRTKPPGETFRYTDNCNCAIGQFLKASGIAVGPDDVVVGADEVGPCGFSKEPEATIPADIRVPMRQCVRSSAVKYQPSFGELLSFYDAQPV